MEAKEKIDEAIESLDKLRIRILKVVEPNAPLERDAYEIQQLLFKAQDLLESLPPNTVPTLEQINDWLVSEAPYNLTGKHIHEYLLSHLPKESVDTAKTECWDIYLTEMGIGLEERNLILKRLSVKESVSDRWNLTEKEKEFINNYLDRDNSRERLSTKELGKGERTFTVKEIIKELNECDTLDDVKMIFQYISPKKELGKKEECKHDFKLVNGGSFQDRFECQKEGCNYYHN